MSNKNNTTVVAFDVRDIKKFLKTDGAVKLRASLLAIILGLLVGFIVMIIAEPSRAWDGFMKVLAGGLTKGATGIGRTLYYAIPILMTGLAVGFAFKMGMFNIGASGQYLMGLYFAIYSAFMFKGLNGSAWHWIICVFAGMIGGMIWGAIPGLFKAFLNVNEVITSIMFNWIGLYLVDDMIIKNPNIYFETYTRTQYLPESAKLPEIGLDKLFPNSQINIAIIIAIIIAIFMYILLNKTIFGYELRATGYNKFAAKYAGMNSKKNIVLAMLIAGGLAGLGGAFYILAPSSIAGASNTYTPANIIASEGFNGIAVALLGCANPIGIIFSAIFISHIQRGGASAVAFKIEIIDIVIAVIIYFSAFALIMQESLNKLIKKISTNVLSKRNDNTENKSIIPNNENETNLDNNNLINNNDMDSIIENLSETDKINDKSENDNDIIDDLLFNSIDDEKMNINCDANREGKGLNEPPLKSNSNDEVK